MITGSGKSTAAVNGIVQAVRPFTMEQKQMTERQTVHFNPSVDKKLKCPCCGEGRLSVATFIVLETVRMHFDKPVTITSGPRCSTYNRKVGGSARSEHLIVPDEDVEAVDFVVEGVKPHDVYAYLDSLPYANLLGLGKYKDFTHMDTRGYRARWKGE